MMPSYVAGMVGGAFVNTAIQSGLTYLNTSLIKTSGVSDKWIPSAKTAAVYTAMAPAGALVTTAVTVLTTTPVFFAIRMAESIAIENSSLTFSENIMETAVIAKFISAAACGVYSIYRGILANQKMSERLGYSITGRQIIGLTPLHIAQGVAIYLGCTAAGY